MRLKTQRNAKLVAPPRCGLAISTNQVGAGFRGCPKDASSAPEVNLTNSAIQVGPGFKRGHLTPAASLSFSPRTAPTRLDCASLPGLPRV